MASIGDLFFALHGDDSQLQLDATKAGDSAGTKAGGTFSDSFGKIVKTAASAVIGAGVGLALKAITDGAVELDAATRKYQADTGATIAETKLAGEQISALFRTNVDGYAVIGDVLAKLRTDLHVTGDDAQALAQDFLHYALATGQEPVAATDALTSAIKAWKVPAEEIPALMDKIVAGHQKYGGSVSDNVDVLTRLAPALTAANLDMNYGIGLLNLFSAAGLDSSKVTTAFAAALKAVHSPEELQTMILKIQSTADGFDRAKLAIALFGAKAGPQLADALAPGTASLSSYEISAAAAAGATDKAAEAIDQGFGNQVVIAFHNVEGALSGLTQNVGPVVDVLDALGNMGINVLPMLGASLGALAPKLLPMLKKLVPVFEVAGAEDGAAMGAAAGAAAIEAEGPAIAAGQAVVAAEAAPAAEAAGAAVGAGVGAGLKAAILALPVAVWLGIAVGAPKLDPKGQLQGELNDQRDKVLAAAGDYEKIGTITGNGFGTAVHVAMHAAMAPILPELTHDFGDYSNAAQVYSNMMLRDLGTVAAGFKSKWSELAADATGAADAIYGAQIRASNLAANTDAQNAELAIINSKKSTAQQKSDAATRLLALQQEGLGIKIEMAGRGELSAKAYAQLITTLNTQAKSSNAEVANAAKLALAELNSLKLAAEGLNNTSLSKISKALADLLNLQSQTGKGAGTKGGTGTGKKLASGGPYAKGDVTTTGEEGWEFDVRAANGYVINHQEALAILAGKLRPASGGQAMSGAPLIGEQHIHGMQPEEVERGMQRAFRRRDLELSLSGQRR